jgi:hypothetical protein
MIIPPIFELGNVTVSDPGVSGQERIIFRPTEQINLAQCGMLLGWRETEGMTVPLNNEFFWFGEVIATPPCWIVVYTGKGNYSQGTHNGQPVYFYYWGKETAIFNCREVIPLVIKFGGVQFGGHLKQLPSFENLRAKLKLPPAAR